MISHRSITKTILLSTIIFLSFSFGNKVEAQDGKALFSQNCAACHAVDKRLVGPALAGVQDRWPDEKKLYSWIRNNQAFLKTGDAYANNLYNEFGKVPMNLFPSLSDAEIGAILKYIKDFSKPAAAAPAAAANTPAPEGDSTLLFGILTLILAIIAFTLMQVNSNLRKLSADKDGEAYPEPVPFWKNKAYIAFVTIVLFLVGGYYTTKGAIGLGRNKGYQPEQPIMYSHKVHAGINQINCLYCHGGAQDSKHASIPSLNVCMNCHMAINEYKGPKFYTEEGVEVNGTAQIQKLYEYAGFTPGQPWDPSKAKPIEWVKIHNLPDHVYFNHSQHIKAGKVQCQTCHGEITNMDEVKQFADLSMGWCINCHRQTQVQFKDNGFYSIFEKYHEDLKNGKLDSTKGVTVEMIGGTECQRCHY
ncbi:MAG: c-type cytochrome [Bacteroidota bacterium]|nr:c-type cytochrome [Bacteroidota bacterium]